MSVVPVLYIEAEKKLPKNTKFSIRCFKRCKIVKKGECSAPLWSFNLLSKLMPLANCVQFSKNPFCRAVHEVVYLMTGTIQIKLYKICSSHQVENPELSITFSFFRYVTH